MGWYLLRRVTFSLLAVVVVASVVFVLLRLTPGDPAATYIGLDLASDDAVNAVREKWGLNDSLLVQYKNFVTNLLRGDLGESFVYGESAVHVVLWRMPNTILLAAVALLFTVLVAVPLGILAARNSGKTIDNGIGAVAIAFQSMPEFWLSIILIQFFALRLGWFPTSGFSGWRSVILPGFTVSLLQLALVSQIVRRELIRLEESPVADALRARGVSERRLLWGHLVRNSGIPVLTVLGTRFAMMINGIVIIEAVFNWPGVGNLAVQSLRSRDYPLIQANVLITSMLAVVINLLVDLSYYLIDPRVRRQTAR